MSDSLIINDTNNELFTVTNKDTPIFIDGRVEVHLPKLRIDTDLIIGEDSIFIVNCDLDLEGTLHIRNRGRLVVKGNASIKWVAVIESDSVLDIKGNATFGQSLILSYNTCLKVREDLIVGKSFRIGISNSVLVEGNVLSKSMSLDNGSVVCIYGCLEYTESLISHNSCELKVIETITGTSLVLGQGTKVEASSNIEVLSAIIKEFCSVKINKDMCVQDGLLIYSESSVRIKGNLLAMNVKVDIGSQVIVSDTLEVKESLDLKKRCKLDVGKFLHVKEFSINEGCLVKLNECVVKTNNVKISSACVYSKSDFFVRNELIIVYDAYLSVGGNLVVQGGVKLMDRSKIHIGGDIKTPILFILGSMAQIKGCLFLDHLGHETISVMSSIQTLFGLDNHTTTNDTNNTTNTTTNDTTNNNTTNDTTNSNTTNNTNDTTNSTTNDTTNHMTDDYANLHATVPRLPFVVIGNSTVVVNKNARINGALTLRYNSSLFIDETLETKGAVTLKLQDFSTKNMKIITGKKGDKKIKIKVKDLNINLGGDHEIDKDTEIIVTNTLTYDTSNKTLANLVNNLMTQGVIKFSQVHT